MLACTAMRTHAGHNSVCRRGRRCSKIIIGLRVHMHTCRREERVRKELNKWQQTQEMQQQREDNKLLWELEREGLVRAEQQRQQEELQKLQQQQGLQMSGQDVTCCSHSIISALSKVYLTCLPVYNSSVLA